MIYVRTIQGRVARSAPRGGIIIPHDRYVPVEHSEYIDRLLNVHGDIEVQQPAQTPVATPAEAAKAAVTKTEK